MRKAVHDAERRERDKALKKPDHNNRPKWRKLNDGGIAFGNKFKIGRGGQIGFGVVGFVIVFFVVGLTLYPLEAQEGGECANPFCEWVDILTGADEYGAKQTPREEVPLEDRDFLPPSEMLLPHFLELPELIGGGVTPIFLPDAEARGEDEPRCYTCKDEGQKKTESEDANEEVVEAKKELEKIKDNIRDYEKKLGEIEIKLQKLRLDINILKGEVEDLEDSVKEMKRQVRHAYDAVITKEDTVAADELSKKYQDEKEKLEKKEKDLFKKEKERDDNKVLLEEYEEKLRIDELYLPVVLDRVDDAKVDANKVWRHGQFISIVLSETCNTLIREDMNEAKVAVVDETGWVYDEEITNRCPTNKQLVEAFDNTIPMVSGEWVERDNDIHREPSQYKDYWKYYKQMPDWQIITVEPDWQMYHRSAIIEIQSRSFTFTDNIGSDNKTPSYTPGAYFPNGTIVAPTKTLHKDISISQHCRHIMVAPDMELITEALNYLMSDCEDENPGDKFSITTQLPFLPPQVQDSDAWKYLQWLKSIAKEFRVE